MRSRVERGLRLGAWAALALAVWLAWRGPAQPPVRASDGTPDMATLRQWASSPPADTVQVAFTGLPTDTVRARVAGLGGAGIAIAWRDDGVLPLAAEVELDETTGSGVVRVAGGAAEVVDAAGPVGRVTEALTVPGLMLPVTAGVRPSAERVPARRAVVLGTPTWELRWVIGALEATGWVVDVGVEIAPELATPMPTFDTATVGVAVVLDRVSVPVARALARYVRSGGGLVLAPDALTSPVLAGLAPGATGPARRPPASLALPDGRGALAFQPVVRMTPDAVPLDAERVAARVEGAGRVVLVGEIETWRLALASDAGRTEHARFWGRVTQAARYRPSGTRAAGDPAPRAALLAVFGAPVEATAPSVPRLPWEALAFTLALAALLAEWASRRMRGAA